MGCGDEGFSSSSGGDGRGSSMGDSDGFGGGGGAVPGEVGGGGGGDDGGDGCEDCPPPEPGQLTAGEWRDLDDWTRWTDLLDGDFGEHIDQWGIDTRGRVPVTITADGAPLAGAHVALVDAEGRTEWETRTDVRGEAELFAGAFESADTTFHIEARSGELSVASGDVEPSAERTTLELDGAIPARRALDLMFVIDTTGSMGDELWYIQSELANVIERAQARASQRFDLRISVNLYRDEGDEYVVRSHEFTANSETAVAQLAAETASGGGDWPEAVDAAMEDAISGHAWSEEAAGKLLFLVLDAPPHGDEAKLERLRSALAGAAERGVRIASVSGTGVDEATEALLRSMGVATGGTYVFLTDDSGIGGTHLEPTVGEFDVEYLNDLMARLVVQAVE